MACVEDLQTAAAVRFYRCNEAPIQDQNKRQKWRKILMENKKQQREDKGGI